MGKANKWGTVQRKVKLVLLEHEGETLNSREVAAIIKERWPDIKHLHASRITKAAKLVHADVTTFSNPWKPAEMRMGDVKPVAAATATYQGDVPK